jgi:hypothetical protein
MSYSPWEQEPYRPRVDSPPAMTGSGVFISQGDVLRLSCEYSVRRAMVRGGYDVLDETCGAILLVYPATALQQTELTQLPGVERTLLPATVGQTWLTQHTMTYTTPLDVTPVGGEGGRRRRRRQLQLRMVREDYSQTHDAARTHIENATVAAVRQE